MSLAQPDPWTRERNLYRLLRAGLASPSALATAWTELGRPAALLSHADEQGIGVYLRGLVGAIDEREAGPAGRARAHSLLRVRWLEGALLEVDGALASHGLRAALLKGPSLAGRLYPPGNRTSLDLDLLVRRERTDATLAALGEAGWRVADSAAGQRYARAHHHHVHLRRAGAPLLELHFRALTGFGSEIPAAPLLEAARPLPGRRALLSLDPTHELLYLAVHAAGHLYERALWLVDLALLDRAEAPDWDAAGRLARRFRLTLPLALTRHLLEARLGVASEGPELGLAARASALRLLDLDRRVEPGGSAQVALRLGFQALLTEGLGSRAGFLAHHGRRVLKRRLRRRFPAWAPEVWAG